MSHNDYNWGLPLTLWVRGGQPAKNLQIKTAQGLPRRHTQHFKFIRKKIDSGSAKQQRRINEKGEKRKRCVPHDKSPDCKKKRTLRKERKISGCRPAKRYPEKKGFRCKTQGDSQKSRSGGGPVKVGRTSGRDGGHRSKPEKK